MNNRFLLLIILAVGGLLRFAWLGEIPSGFFRDEAALGYNAYSIWQTGKDEFGVFYPLIFRSFEVFFLPLYIYLSAPIVGIFGLSEFTARFLSAFSGFIALLVIYKTSYVIDNKRTALFSLVLLATSPWHLFFSRGTFEGNLALTLFTFGFLFLILFFKTSKQRFIFLSFISFSFSMYSYQSERVVVPLLGVFTLIFYFRQIVAHIKLFLLPGTISFLTLIPLLLFSFQTAGVHRAFGVSVFNKIPQGFSVNSESKIFENNDVFLRVKQIAALYLSYLSPRNLFFEADYDKQRSIEKLSVFYSWYFVLLVAGVVAVLTRRNKFDKLLIAWVLAAPVPAALTGDPFHTYRSLLLYFPLTLLCGIGLNNIYENLNCKKILLLGFGVLSVVSVFYFAYYYAIITQATRARDWDFGYREIFSYLGTNNFKRVVVQDKWTEPYIHMLFFNKIEPKIYHQYIYSMGDPTVYYYSDASEIRPEKVLNFEFKQVDWPTERGDKGTVFVFNSKDLPESEFKGDPNIELLKEIKYPDGQSAYRIIKIND